MPSHHRVVVIGAGPAGLSVGACLYRRGIEALLLERHDEVATSWRRHYERLHLHTLKRFSTLPHHPWPAHVPTYPSRQDVVDYLAAYATRFPQPTRFGALVSRARRAPDGGWLVSTQDDELACEALVVATGYNRVPRVPNWPGRDEYEGALLHSSRYTSGKPWRGRRALVVGAGNSGAEIALDLWEQGVHSALCIRSPVHVVPRDLFGTPAQVTAILLSWLPARLADALALPILARAVGDLSAVGIVRPAIGPAAQLVSEGRVALLDVGTVALVRQRKIDVVPGIERFTRRGVVLVDGREHDYDVVVLATGYQCGIEAFLDGAERHLDAHGRPRVHGREAEPGLCFVGFHNRPVGLLNDIARDARAAARAIARRLDGRARLLAPRPAQ